MTQTQLRLPAGYAVRAQRDEDITAIAEFFRRFDLRMGGYSDFTEEDLGELDRHPRFDPATDSWVVSHDDTIVGYARVWNDDPGATLESFGAVDPDHTGLGIGSLLVSSVEARAYEYAAGKSVALRNFADANDERGGWLLSNKGFELVRHHYTMSIKLGDAPADVGRPDGFTIRSCTLEDAPLMHALIEEVFVEHWGHVPSSYDEWSQMVLKREDIDPSLWFVAEVGTEPVGVLLAQVEDGRGWVSDLGTRSAWRRRGIARSLLQRAFAEFTKRGLPEAALGVDAGNETGAVALYEGVGMRPIKVYQTYEKRLSAV
jgi:mycothiol synthase